MPNETLHTSSATGEITHSSSSANESAGSGTQVNENESNQAAKFGTARFGQSRFATSVIAGGMTSHTNESANAANPTNETKH